MNKALAILRLFPQTDPLKDFVVQDDSDGNGPYIAAWNLPDPQPTETELEMAWEAYEAEEATKPQSETDAQKIARLETEKTLLGEQVAEINRNFTDFVDFYFTNNPELV